jgi:hypothetical protein
MLLFVKIRNLIYFGQITVKFPLKSKNRTDFLIIERLKTKKQIQVGSS